MPFSENGANYRNQAELERRDRVLGEALADLASQVQAVRSQANLGQAGPPSPPSALTAIQVSAAGGFVSVSLTHPNPPSGTQYVIEYSATPNFQNPVRIDNGISTTWEQYLSGKTLYFRGAPKLPASALAPWVYFGGTAKPTAVVI